MTTATILNPTDVPLVSPEDLAVPMQYMIDTGRGLAMLRGLSPAEMREIDHAMWDRLDPAVRVAVLVRFRCMIRVFGASRLADLLMRNGYNLIAPAVHVAARMRLNADRGFSAPKFERALQELLAKIAQGQRHSAETSDLLAA